MEQKGRSQRKPDIDIRERAERLSQVRHLQTLRWAYLSTYLASIGWFLSIYFGKDSTLQENRIAAGVISLTLAALGVFLSIRVFHFTKIIRHDLDKIGTTVRGLGWLEYVFMFVVTLVVLILGILTLFGIS
jgi:mannose/fructose/N-acetylgalactosamine-specific phosphotransferase system component IIC